MFYDTLPHLTVSFFFFLMIRRPPRSTLDRSSAASDVYKRQGPGYVASDWALPANGPSPALMLIVAALGFRVFTVPVSYTHLRAHETVLDLVCRLLLEKKKQNKSRSRQTVHKKNVDIEKRGTNTHCVMYNTHLI